MAYIYWIHKKDGSGGYIGQSVGSDLGRLFDHIDVAYNIKTRYANATDAPKLMNLISNNGVCNCDFIYNDDTANCYGLAEAFQEFDAIWDYKPASQKGAALTHKKLDFVEICLTFAGRTTFSWANRDEGGQGKFLYKTKRLIKEISELPGSEDTKRSIIKALKNTDLEFSWTTKGPSNPATTEMLIWPERYIFAKVLQEHVINNLINTKMLTKIIVQSLKDSAVVLVDGWFKGKESQTELKQSLSTALQKYVQETSSQIIKDWNKFLTPNYHIRLSVDNIRTNDIADILVKGLTGKITLSSKGDYVAILQEASKTIKWADAQKLVIQPGRSQDKPKWLQMIDGLTPQQILIKSANTAAKNHCIFRFQEAYNSGLDIQTYYQNARYVTENWNAFYDQMMNEQFKSQWGSLDFTQHGDYYAFGRKNIINQETGNFKWLGMVDENEMQEMISESNKLTIY